MGTDQKCGSVLNGGYNNAAIMLKSASYMVWATNNAVSPELPFEWLYAMINASNTMINQAK